MDWQKNQLDILTQVKTVVVKVGSAVLATGTPETLDIPVLYDIVKQLVALQATGRRVVLVSSGAVLAGRLAFAANAQGLDKKALPYPSGLAGKQAAASVGQGRLMHMYEAAFAVYTVLTAQVLLTREDIRDRERFLNMRNTLNTLLDWGVIPIVNENDAISIREIKFSDNDNLASLLINVVEADLFINMTTAGGVLAANPKEQPNAPCLPYIDCIRDLDLAALCGDATSLSGTGGMYTKLLAAKRAAQLGVPTAIISGKMPDAITRLFAHEALGTWVCPETRTVSRRKYWLAYRGTPEGELVVDKGAAKALESRGKSLLPVGVCEVIGDFGAGALVRIRYEGRTLGLGLCNYASRDVVRMCGLRGEELTAVLGAVFDPEVVHRDNLLQDVAL